jgi:hypothetical protein
VRGGERLRSAVRRARHVPPSRWPGLVRTALLLGLVEVGLRTVRLPRVARWAGVTLAATPSAAAGTAPTDPDVEPEPLRLGAHERGRIRDARAVLSVPGVDGTCLRQALVVGNALRARSPQLVLGVAKHAGAVSAHAWIEVQGWVVDDYRVHAGPPPGLARMPVPTA